MWHHVLWRVGTNILEEPVAFIFMVEAEEGGRRFFWNTDTYLLNYTLSHVPAGSSLNSHQFKNRKHYKINIWIWISFLMQIHIF